MKLAPQVVLLLRDSEGFVSAISEALRPKPPQSVSTLDECFELSLEQYGIKDHKASGNIVHYVDDSGIYQVSVLILQSYEPPILACAVNEVLSRIAGEHSLSSSPPTLVIPFVVTSSKLKSETKIFAKNDHAVSLYGIKIGPETDITQNMAAKVEKLPSNLQIHHEQLACCLHLVRILNLPSIFVVGQTGRRLSSKSTEEDIQTLSAMGEILASFLALGFSREAIVWDPKDTRNKVKEPWRALYG